MSHLTSAAPVTGRPGRVWTRADTRSLARLLGVVAALHVVGWGGLLLLAAPGSSLAGGVLGLGLGVTAYAFGVRHAFDVDHIAVIDGATRKLTADGGRPLSVGLWFSLGHSTVVFVLALLLATGARFATSLMQDGSRLHDALSTFGTGAAGAFLWVIGLVNLVAFAGVLRARRRLVAGTLPDHDLEHALHHGPAGVARVLGGLTRSIKHPAQAYPVGLLMGLGLDTATEIALLVLAGTAAVTLPWYAVLVLPVLFAAGMSLFDTLDGAVMNVAYDWAFARPLRKLNYNAVVTGVSVVVALGVGTVQLTSMMSDTLGLTGTLTGWTARVPLADSGLYLVAVLLGAWAVAAWWHARRPAGHAVTVPS
jgi:nickel/cobalt transporter (NiCoT) family protein